MTWIKELGLDGSDKSRKWAELWVKDKAWQEEQRETFGEARESVHDQVRSAWERAKEFWAQLDTEADKKTGKGAGALRQVKMAINRWQARKRLSDLLSYKVLSQKILTAGKNAYDDSGWAAIGADYKNMKFWAVSSWGNLRDVTKYTGGVIQAPASVLHAKLGVPIAKLHDWLENEALPGFKISVKQLARRKQRFSRKFDKDGNTSFVDGDTGETVVPPRTSKHADRAKARAAQKEKIAVARAGARTQAKETNRLAKKESARRRKARLTLTKAYQKALSRWRSLRMRQDAEGVRQAKAAEIELRKRAEKLQSLGIPLSDEG